VLDTVCRYFEVRFQHVASVGERDGAFGVGDRGDTFAEGDCEASFDLVTYSQIGDWEVESWRQFYFFSSPNAERKAPKEVMGEIPDQLR
jgi:hypothetical protein